MQIYYFSMKNLVQDFSFFWRKHALLTAEISSFFLWESQNKGQWIPLQFFSFLHFAPSCGHCHSSSERVSMAVRMCFTLFVYIYFRGGSSSVSSSSFCWLSSSAKFSKPPLENCCPWLPAPLFYVVITLSNPVSCTSLLTSSAIFSTNLNPVKLCLNSGRHLCHTPFKQFTDTSTQPALTLFMPFKLLNVWPVQNSHHFHEGLAEVTGSKGCYYSAPLVAKVMWCFMACKQYWRPGCWLQQGLQEGQGKCPREEEPWLGLILLIKTEHCTTKVVCVTIQEELLCHPSLPVPFQ